MSDNPIKNAMIKDADGFMLQTCRNIGTKGYEPVVAQVFKVDGDSDGTDTDAVVTVNSTEFPLAVEPYVAPVAEVHKIDGDSDGSDTDATVTINSTPFNLAVEPYVAPVAEVYKIDGDSDGTLTEATVTINATPFDLDVAATEAAVAQVDSVTGAPVSDPITVTVTINTTEIEWNISNIADMGTEYEELLSLINNTSEPVTASYINEGDHSAGIYVTADVAGTPFTLTLDGEDGTLAAANVTPNNVEVTLDEVMIAAYEAFLAAVNAGAEPVTATYVNEGDHSLGVLLTADVAGTAFTCVLADETGTMAATETVANVAEITINERMITAYETFLGLVNAGAEPVTATYVDAGDHSLGVLLTADVAGTAFTCVLANETGTMADTETVANVVEITIDARMITAYETFLALINAGSEPVTATYVNAGDHSLGVLLTADVAGISFTCTLDDETGTMAVAQTVANVAKQTTEIQSPVALDTTEEEIEAPYNAVAMIIKTDDPIWIDTATGVGDDQGIDLVSDTYIQIPVRAGESIFLVAETTAYVSFAFLLV